MGDVLVAFLVLLAVAICLVAGGMFLTQSGAKRNRMNSAPAVLIPPGSDPDVLVANATRSYMTAQAAVRLLERLGNDRAVEAAINANLGSDTLEEMRAVVDQFYTH